MSPRLRVLKRLSWLAPFALALTACQAGSPAEPLGQTSEAVSAPSLFPTGVDANGNLLAVGATDPHYVLTASNDGTAPVPPGTIYVVTPNAAWVANTTTGQWVSPEKNTMGATTPGTYTYTTTFTVGALSSTANISGTWTCDNTCTASVNGKQFAALTNVNSYGASQPFTIPNVDLVMGTNTVEFAVVNTSAGPTGLAVLSVVESEGCVLDSDCTATQFCDTQTSVCIPKEANGTPIPVITGHTPPLTGACNAAVGTSVCASGECVATGATTGICVQCNANTQCSGATPACNLTTNTCVQCTSDTQCAGATPVCNTTTSTCVACNGDNGTVATEPCPSTDPFCFLPGSGSTAGQCGKCTSDAQCTGHAGTSCDMASGLCVAGCFADAECAGGDWCNAVLPAAGTCVPKIPNGTTLPASPGSVSTCNPATGVRVCVSGVCDTNGNICGLADGDGTCISNDDCVNNDCNLTTGICGSGCKLDTDCMAGNWCNAVAPGTGSCVPKLANGTMLPTSPSSVSMCNPASGARVCVSGVCDTNGNICGLADGDGTCISNDACVNSDCNLTTGICGAGCRLDTDCTAGDWCNAVAPGTGSCVPKLANGTMLPTSPSSVSMCNPATGARVCVSGVCDTNGNICGLADGDGTCISNDACVNNDCNLTTGICGSGCKLDTDCMAGNWCNAVAPGTGSCVPKLANGTMLPTSPSSVSMCNPATGMRVCVSGVCDTDGNICGLADGDGTCTANAQCVNNDCNLTTGICGAGCKVDTDCSASDWCNAVAPGTGSCVAKVANGQPLPSSPGSVSMCSGAVGTRVCVSGICDPNGNICGLSDGDGTCTASAQCVNNDCNTTTGICTPPGCAVDTDCSTGDWCNAVAPAKGTCEPKVANGQPLPSSPSSVATCTTAVGTRVCVSGVCDTNGNICGLATGDGTCTTNAECVSGSCDTTTMKCQALGCTADAQCPSGDWCNAIAPATGTCEPKIANGQPLPSSPSSVATCTTSVGTRVCVSGVCDTKGNICGLADGDGPCSSNAQCVNSDCNTATMICEPTPTGCTSDASCPTGDYCPASGTCTPKEPDGTTCTAANQCTSAVCAQGVCGGGIIGSGGVRCSAQPAKSSGGEGAAAFGLLAALGLARRRRSTKASTEARP